MMVPTNQFLRDVIYSAPPEGWRITYRQTPAGQPLVPDLLRPGDRIEIRQTLCDSAHVKVATVHSVVGPFHYPDPGPDYPCFSVVLKDEKGRADGHINECVAVDGVVRGLFEANDMEICVVGRAVGVIPEPTRPVAQPSRRPEQLSLF